MLQELEWLLCNAQGKFLKDYAAAHEALSKLGTQLPVTLYGGSAVASKPFGYLSDSYSTSEVSMLQNLHVKLVKHTPILYLVVSNSCTAMSVQQTAQEALQGTVCTCRFDALNLSRTAVQCRCCLGLLSSPEEPYLQLDGGGTEESVC